MSDRVSRVGGRVGQPHPTCAVQQDHAEVIAGQERFALYPARNADRRKTVAPPGYAEGRDLVGLERLDLPRCARRPFMERDIGDEHPARPDRARLGHEARTLPLRRLRQADHPQVARLQRGVVEKVAPVRFGDRGRLGDVTVAAPARRQVHFEIVNAKNIEVAVERGLKGSQVGVEVDRDAVDGRAERGRIVVSHARSPSPVPPGKLGPAAGISRRPAGCGRSAAENRAFT